MTDQRVVDGASPGHDSADDHQGDWYALHVFSGRENRVAEALNASGGSGGPIDEVLIPTEKVLDVRNGKRREVERRFMPGYVLVRMRMDKASYHEVVSQPNVIGFLGIDTETDLPTPITQDEINRVRDKVIAGEEQPRPSISFVEGEPVRVIDGPFEGLEGHVEDVDEARERLKVMMRFFGRSVLVDLEFGQVQKTS